MAEADNRLRVGDWTVEPELNRLSRSGKIVKIEPKAMSLLLHLANRPGEVVSREALLSEIWPNVVVGDDSLTQVIIKLRKALGDDADEPAYIQTVTKRGYRLVAAVAQLPQATAKPNPQRWRSSFWVAAAAAAAMLAAAGLWWGERERSGVLPRAEPPSNVSELPTIAIAPFDALGKESQELLLARGIAADLATDLSKSLGLSVMGFAPLEAHAAAEASTHPKARYLVSGSVQRIEGRLRLHVYLTDQSTGQKLWSERFDRELTDLFSIQDELAPKIVRVLPAKVTEAELRRMARRQLAPKIVRVLPAKVTEAELRRMARRHTRNLEAYEYFQRGQAALLVRQQSGNELARQMFRRATELDVTFARAYSGLALTYAADYRNGWTPDGARALERALELARTANGMNPDIPETYWALAYVHAQRRQHEQALGYLEKSLSLYPSFADGYALMASIKTFVGQPADTVPLMRTAIRLNPKSGYLYFLVLGRAYFFLSELEQARINLDEAMKRNPGYLETHIYMAALNLAQGDKGSAAWEADQIRSLDPEFAAKRWLDNYPMTDAQERRKLANVLHQLGM